MNRYHADVANESARSSSDRRTPLRCRRLTPRLIRAGVGRFSKDSRPQLLVTGLVLGLALFTPTTGRSDGTYPRISLENPWGTDRCILEFIDGCPFIPMCHMWVDVVCAPGTFPIRSVSFSIPEPSCFYADSVEIESFGTVTGDWRTGITVDFGECRTSAVRIMRLKFILVSASEINCVYPILAHASSASGEIEVVDCEGQTRLAIGEAGIINWDGGASIRNEPPPPSYPSPADGATDVGISEDLNWDWSDGSLCRPVLHGSTYHNLYFGTEPDPPLLYEWAWPPYKLGPLMPSTTYYWRVVTKWGPSPSSPVWSFTTEDPTPTDRSTWGAIKAVYE